MKYHTRAVSTDNISSFLSTFISTRRDFTISTAGDTMDFPGDFQGDFLGDTEE